MGGGELKVDFENLTRTSGEWLRGTGPESDIVISSRIRLARNVADFPFCQRSDEVASESVGTMLQEYISSLESFPDLEFLSVHEMEQLDRKFLVERQLISREHADSEGWRGAMVEPRESVSLMINEEDHLRMQVIRSGFALDECWEQINRIDDELEEHVSFAFSDEFGYLTSCPTNAGTGMRVSVMLHLPALVMTKEIQKVFQAMQKMSLAVRGLYGEGSQAMGDFYQISNQVTLGKSESQIIQTVKKVIPDILSYERRARTALIKEDRQRLHDQISRALGVLSSARQITSEETMELLSSVRLGINLGLVDDIEIPTVNELFMHTQPAHLQKIRRETLGQDERNVVRASYLRERLTNAPPSSN